MTARRPWPQDAWPLLVVTDRRMASAGGRSLAAVVGAAVDAGAPAVLVREKDLPPGDRGFLAEGLRRVTAAAGAALVVAADDPAGVALALAAGADAVHLSARAPWPAGDAAAAMAIGRSCHSEADLRDAAAAGAAHVTYSPVWPTPSKPGHGPALGPAALTSARRALTGPPRPATVPAGRPWLVALGGVGAGNARACREAGADAVAVMGAVMRAGDPAAVVRDLLAELLEGSPRG
jgi:thiamine-phosphate pyrophosphorylase